MITKHRLVPVILASLSITSTSVLNAEEMSGPSQDQQVVSCDDETREFVLTENSPLFNCSVERELNGEQVLQCKKIVACMIEEGIVLDQGTLARFGESGLSTGGIVPK